jgi:deferrochelatase/peroxidase EfeB
MKGVDPPDEIKGGAMMKTDANIIIVLDSSFTSGGKRPAWMNDGTFLVFRKLAQNIKAFNDLVNQWENYGCTSREQMGAKLVGRWENGKGWTISSFLPCC